MSDYEKLDDSELESSINGTIKAISHAKDYLEALTAGEGSPKDPAARSAPIDSTKRALPKLQHELAKLMEAGLHPPQR